MSQEEYLYSAFLISSNDHKKLVDAFMGSTRHARIALHEVQTNGNLPINLNELQERVLTNCVPAVDMKMYRNDLRILVSYFLGSQEHNNHMINVDGIYD